jgi:hypothetical protein
MKNKFTVTVDTEKQHFDLFINNIWEDSFYTRRQAAVVGQRIVNDLNENDERCTGPEANR